MVIEGVITTENPDGSMHVAPIGPHVNPQLTQWVLKPFQSSTTFANLRATQRGIFHVIDDALLMAAAVLGLLNSPVELLQHASDEVPKEWLQSLAHAQKEPQGGWSLAGACGLYSIQIDAWDISEPRAHADCSLAWTRQQHVFWGWNRAKHSILELAVLASRVHMLDQQMIADDFARHQKIIEKTAGPREQAAFWLLHRVLSP